MAGTRQDAPQPHPNPARGGLDTFIYSSHRSLGISPLFFFCRHVSYRVHDGLPMPVKGDLRHCVCHSLSLRRFWLHGSHPDSLTSSHTSQVQTLHACPDCTVQYGKYDSNNRVIMHIWPWMNKHNIWKSMLCNASLHDSLHTGWLSLGKCWVVADPAFTSSVSQHLHIPAPGPWTDSSSCSEGDVRQVAVGAAGTQDDTF
mmetsp:Transcript_36060/g.64513  ORF Transcript_36060/g.64513 Transcript_36060/m.64513 type:complete len:200 (-) Transcript_36060:784-1383(-)